MTADELAFCKKWCASHAKTWQVLNRSEWKYVFHPQTLVRYVDEVRMTEGEIQLILEFLSSDNCIDTLSLYDQSISSSWAPTRAWLEVGNKSVQGVRSVRLYHGLQKTHTASDGPYLVENGCAYKVTLWYFWSQPSVTTTITDGGTTVAVPSHTSGVNYSISGLQRDTETGLYTYAVEKKERVQQDVAEYLAVTTVYEDTKKEEHLGVKQDALDTTGQQASVGDGKIVRRTISKNADCTSNIDNTITQEKAVSGASVQTHVGLTGKTVTTTNRNMTDPADASSLDIGESVENSKTEGGRWNQVVRRVTQYFIHLSDGCRKTVFAHTHSTSDVQGTDPGFTHVSDASGGVIRNKSVSRTSDGGYKIDEDVTTEKPVTGASEGTHASLTGVTKTTVNRNQADKASSDGLDVGESIENTKTEGGLWNQTIRRIVRSAYIWLGSSCQKTLFSHAHGNRHVQGTNPGFTHVEEASGGVVHKKNVSRTSDGSYEVDEQTITEKPISDATEQVSVELTGETVVKTHRNQSDKASTYNLDVGESVENRKTEGGLWDQVIRKATRRAIHLSDSCRKTIFAHIHGKSDVQGDNPGFTHVEEASGGVIKEKNVSRTSNGSYKIDEQTITEKAVSDAGETVRVGLSGEVVTTVRRNQPNKADTTGLDVGQEVENTKTDGGLWNHVLRSVKKTRKIHLSNSCRKTVYQHVDSKSDVQCDNPGFTHTEDASDGVIVEKSVSRTSDGTYKIDEQKTVEKNVPDSVVTHRKVLGGIVTRTERKGQNVKLDVPSKTGDSVTNVKTPGGLYDTTEDHAELEPYHSSPITIRRTGNGQIISSVETRVGRNLKTASDVVAFAGSSVSPNEEIRVSENINERGEYDVNTHKVIFREYEKTKTWYDDVYAYFVKEFKNKPSIPNVEGEQNSAHISFRVNEHGTYDGTITYRNYNLASGETLQINRVVDTKGDIIYLKDGKLKCRHVTAKQHYMFGLAVRVIDELSQLDELPQAGFRKFMSVGNPNRAYGIGYSNIVVKSETDYNGPT